MYYKYQHVNIFYHTMDIMKKIIIIIIFFYIILFTLLLNNETYFVWIKNYNIIFDYNTQVSCYSLKKYFQIMCFLKFKPKYNSRYLGILYSSMNEEYNIGSERDRQFRYFKTVYTGSISFYVYIYPQHQSIMKL